MTNMAKTKNPITKIVEQTMLAKLQMRRVREGGVVRMSSQQSLATGGLFSVEAEIRRGELDTFITSHPVSAAFKSAVLKLGISA